MRFSAPACVDRTRVEAAAAMQLRYVGKLLKIWINGVNSARLTR
jgi:hypothetical protein